MTPHLKTILPAALLGLAMLSACSGDTADAPELAETPVAETDAPQDTASFTESFDYLDEGLWYVSEEWKQVNGIFDIVWRREAIEQTDDGLRFAISPDEQGDASFAGASLQRRGGRLHYGRYETVMTAARGKGLVSAFFTYVGPPQGVEQDEIDFEILGRDTTRVQLNYFTSGKGGNEEMIDLGYDSDTTPNLYAFEWTADGIRWYVGDVLVHEAGGPRDDTPTQPGILISQVWAGSPATADWLGRPVSIDDPHMDVLCTSYRAPGDTGAQQCSDDFQSLNTATPSPRAASLGWWRISSQYRK